MKLQGLLWIDGNMSIFLSAPHWFDSRQRAKIKEARETTWEYIGCLPVPSWYHSGIVCIISLLKN